MSAPRWPLSGRPRTAPGMLVVRGAGAGCAGGRIRCLLGRRRTCQLSVPPWPMSAGLAPRAQQPLQLGVLVAVGGVDVDVQPELPGPRVVLGMRMIVGCRPPNRLPAARSRCPVVLASEFDDSPRTWLQNAASTAGIGGVDDQLTDAACHARQCRQATREPVAGHVEGGALRDRALPGGTGSCPAFCACEEGTGCGSPGRPGAPSGLRAWVRVRPEHGASGAAALEARKQDERVHCLPEVSCPFTSPWITLTSFFVAWTRNPCEVSHGPRSEAGSAW